MGVHSQIQQRTDDPDDDDDDGDDAEAEDPDDDDERVAALGPLPQKATKTKNQNIIAKEQNEDNQYLLDLSRTPEMIPSLLECPSLLLSTPQSFAHAAARTNH